ncbi:hypothetical protein MAR_024679 [Mya arenaria]|uniref:Uncharacterized protein n=1 Tax=Mya arenaria TaxID=6604 RepID=A0ABY7DRG7_MYAAR|nr:hypothetical protein MAR_024679 [Mya arenaria]
MSSATYETKLQIQDTRMKKTLLTGKRSLTKEANIVFINFHKEEVNELIAQTKKPTVFKTEGKTISNTSKSEEDFILTYLPDCVISGMTTVNDVTLPDIPTSVGMHNTEGRVVGPPQFASSPTVP